ncbi:hypothetical protein KFL_005260010, partial [Klebsormidium nitens]
MAGGDGETVSLKDQGNAHFKAAQYLKAAATYSKAIKEDPDNATLFSNRSASFLQLNKVTKALEDAEKTIQLRPTWEKGYFRKGCALEALKRYDEALAAFKEAAELNPKSQDITLKIRGMTRLARDSKRSAAGKGPPQEEAVRNEDEYEKAKADQSLGPSIPYSETRVRAFAKRMLEKAADDFVEAGGKLDASVMFQPGRYKEGSTNQEADQSQVAINQAFESPDTLAQCVDFLRRYAVDTGAHAACLVALKSKISFPQRWRGLGERGWKHGSKDGIFVQLEAPKMREVWFIPTNEEKGHCIPG